MSTYLRIPADPDLENEDWVCFCHSVTVSEIVRAVDEGSSTLQDIQNQTLASTGCGGCTDEVLGWLEKRLAKIASK